MHGKWRLWALALSLLAVALTASTAGASTATFTNHQLFGSWDPTGTGLTISPNATSSGDSEPAIAFGGPGGATMAVDGLAWLPFQVNVWHGTFGSTPDYLGGIDTTVPIPGKGRIGLGSGDADIEIAPDGTIVVADLDFVFNKNNKLQLGVSITRCPPSATMPADCSTQVLDQSGADRPWLTHSGDTFYLTYHDSGNSASIHALRSDDAGVTWKRITSPLTGQGPLTGQSTFNNIQGPIVADPNSNDVYDIYASGETKTKCCSADFNNIIVSRSSDGGKSWTAQIVYHAPVGTALDNIFPSLAVDQTKGNVYAVWSDGHDVSLSSAAAGGSTWTTPTTVSDIKTALMPWVAARDDKVDVVYYGSDAEQDDPAGVWNVYDSQSDDAGATFDQNKVSDQPNRVGAVCTEGTGCEGGVNRELLDLFEVAEDPMTDKAAIVYTSSEISTYTTPDNVVHKLPEIVLAYEN
jgi:hypothetical protein